MKIKNLGDSKIFVGQIAGEIYVGTIAAVGVTLIVPPRGEVEIELTPPPPRWEKNHPLDVFP